MIAFWAFFSIFPLLLVLVTLLGYFVPASLKGEVLSRVASFLPLLDTNAIGGLSGQWWTLLVGIVTALYSGTAVVTATQAAFDSVWEIPFIQRSGSGQQLKRSLFALSTIGLGLVISTLISGYITGGTTRSSPSGRTSSRVLGTDCSNFGRFCCVLSPERGGSGNVTE